jgi:hypothetical protein
MFSRHSGNMLGKFLGRSDRQLRDAVLNLLRRNPGREFTFQTLYLKLRPRTAESLALVLDDLARHGAIRRVFRVESPTTHIGIGDYPSIDEIPTRLFDRTSDQDVNVAPDDIRPIFKTA